MTREEKQLLLKDLCARLPYGVKILDVPANVVGDLFLVSKTDTVEYEPVDKTNDDDTGRQTLYNIKPYLRLTSSMTEEEKTYYNTIYVTLKFYEKEIWLEAHHFDYHRLIEKGLALEAPEGMYKTE